MARGSLALVVAAVAAALLVVVVAVDVSLNRTLFVDAREDGGWVTLASSGPTEPVRAPEPVGPPGIPVARNGSLEFRVRVENGHPWSFSDSFRVFASGVIVAEGTLDAPARGDGAATFTVDGERLLAGVGAGPDDRNEGFASLEVHVGDEVIYTGVFVREVA